MYKYRKYILISAIFISIIAEFISIFGLTKLLGGSDYKIIIILMGVGFAIGKLLIATVLKTEYEALNKNLRNYLIGSLIILSVLTSLGIYGLLSDGYSITKSKDNYVQTKISLIKTKKQLFDTTKQELQTQLVSVNSSIEKLRSALSTDNQTQQVVNGKIITNIISSNKTGVQNQLDKALLDKTSLEQKILNVNDSIGSFTLKMIETEYSSTAASELGPLKFISTVSGINMDSVVNYFLLLIILIFDPVALCLLWVYFSIQPPKETKTEEPPVVIEEQAEPVKKPRAVNKKLGRPRKSKVNEMIDSVINPPPADEDKKKL